MVLSRAAALRGALGHTTLRRAGSQARTNAWRQIGRRTYADAHGAKKSSDLPWLIGSVVFTVPAATWLLSQGTAVTTEHGPGAHEKAHEPSAEDADEGSEGEEESSSEKEGADDDSDDKSKDDSKDEDKSEDKDEGEEKSKDEGEKKESDDSDSEGSDDKDTPPTSDDEEADGPSPGSPGQVNKSSSKGPGEQQKGERKPSETKGEKDSASQSSGAQHPYLDDPEKSKKGEGLNETAKVHGTVDTSAKSPRGPEGSKDDK